MKPFILGGLMISAYILSTSIAWGGVASHNQPGYADPEREAIRAMGKALYKEADLDEFTKRLEKRYVPDFIKEYGLWPTLVVKIVTEGRISYEWRF